MVVESASANLPDVDIVESRTDGLPLVIVARDRRTPLSDWLQRNWHAASGSLEAHGGVAFRGFHCPDRYAFLAAVERTGAVPMDIKEESSRRLRLGDSIYTSTEHPPQFEIFPHHESSYSLVVPARVFFYCEHRDGEGGETLLADGCRIWDAIAPAIRNRFEAGGWILHRRYGDGLGVSWQQAYGTPRREDVEAYCAMHDMELQWSGSSLATRQRRAATLLHPGLHRPVWFNHVCFFHHTAIPKDLLRLLLDEGGGLPFDTTYGDAEPIDDRVIAAVREAYSVNTAAFDWQPQDMVVLDNLRMAHGRRAFNGRRQLLFVAADSVRVPGWRGATGAHHGAASRAEEVH